MATERAEATPEPTFFRARSELRSPLASSASAPFQCFGVLCDLYAFSGDAVARFDDVPVAAAPEDVDAALAPPAEATFIDLCRDCLIRQYGIKTLALKQLKQLKQPK